MTGNENHIYCKCNFLIFNCQQVGVVRGWGVGLVHWLIDQRIWENPFLEVWKMNSLGVF